MKIKVLSKKVTIIDEKGKENTFYRYFTPVKISVVDVDGKNLGIQEKSLSVHFTKKATKKLLDDKVFSTFECKPEDVGCPYVYHIMPKEATNDDRAKNDVWIRDFETETPIPYTNPKSTCQFVTEETSEPVEIIDND